MFLLYIESGPKVWCGVISAADPCPIVRDAAREIGLAPKRFAEIFDDPATVQAVEADRQRARLLQVQSVPTLIIRETGARLVNGPREDLAAQIHAAMRLLA